MKKYHPHNVTYKRRHTAKMKRKEEQRQKEILHLYDNVPEHARLSANGTLFLGSQTYGRIRSDERE